MNTPEMLERARRMRGVPTNAERIFWLAVRDRRLDGYKFRRQVRIGRYIVDFVCEQAMLIVEIDGGQHADSQIYDEKRTLWLENRGYRVVRFWSNEVLAQLSSVLQVLLEYLHTHGDRAAR